MPRPHSALDVASLLLDFYELPSELVFSPEINVQELLLLGINKLSWKGYTNALQAKQYEAESKRK